MGMMTGTGPLSRKPAGHHGRVGVGGVEVDRRVLESDLAHALGRGRAAAHGVVTRAAVNLGRFDPAPVEDDPAQAAHAVAAEFGGRAVRVEEPGLGHGPGRLVKVDAVAAERAAAVAQVPDERAQVGLGREVTGGELGDEDVVQRAVRVQDLGHRRPAYPNARGAKLARACWPAP